MSLAVSYSAQLVGLSAEIINIEVDISNGLNSFSVVGLGDRAVGEARDRVAAAIKNSGYVSPKQKNQKVVISLAPADMRKEGPVFDLAMAVTYLSAAGDISLEPSGKLFLGELSLDGRVRKVSGLLLILCQARERGFTQAFIPAENTREASLARDITVFAVSSLQETVSHLSGEKPLQPISREETSPTGHNPSINMSSVRGNETAKRALEIAAAGAHNLIMCGPPGTGKTMLAQSFPSILPALSYEESVEVTGIHSAARVLQKDLIAYPPFRSPHHTASYPAIIGGGAIPRPGEITLAHHGVLFLDELPEFDRSVIDALRQPLEDRIVTICRAKSTVTFPASCILIAAMNPCPCGKGKELGCACLPHQIEAYNRRVSGPILDRMDIWIRVNKIDYAKLSASTSTEEPSEKILKRVVAAREIQRKRFIGSDADADSKMNNSFNNFHVYEGRFRPKLLFNAGMEAGDIERFVFLDEDLRSLLASSAKKFGFSGRAFHRVIKVARTIADLANESSIKKEHLLEAFQYREKMHQ